MHLIEWHKKVISFSDWRHFQITYPSFHQEPGAIATPPPTQNLTKPTASQDSLSNEILVMPLEDGTKLEPNDSECFEVPVQVQPFTKPSTNPSLSSVAPLIPVQTGAVNENPGQRRKDEFIYIPDDEKNQISNNYISNVKEAMDQFIQTYHLSTRH